MIEKMEECPNCGVHDDRWFYDGQSCSACGWSFFDLGKARRRSRTFTPELRNEE